jgi:hypothetical protein
MPRGGRPDRPCEARSHKRSTPTCGKPGDTVRRIQAAPGLWIHIDLCHAHQHVWDEAWDWGGPDVKREDPPCWICPPGEDSDGTRAH